MANRRLFQTVVIIASILASRPALSPAGPIETPQPRAERSMMLVNPLWGSVFLIQSASAHRDLMTWVEGGAVGSAFLVQSSPRLGMTSWYLIDGEHLWLRQIHAVPKIPKAFTPGTYLMGAWRSTNLMPYDADKHWLTDQLVKAYGKDNSRSYTPFLIGRGWSTDQNGNQGATLAQVQALALPNAHNFEIDWMDSEEDRETTGVVIAQSPSAGRQFPPFGASSRKIYIRLSGETVNSMGTPPGNSPDDPIDIADRNQGRQIFVKIQGHTANVTAPTNCTNAHPVDVVWLLPEDIDETVTAAWLGVEDSELTLSIWEYDRDNDRILESVKCDTDINPMVRYDCDDAKDYAIVADLPADVDWVQLHVGW